MSFIQQIINHLYRYPKSNLKTIQRFGGHLSYGKMLIEKQKMIKASQKISSILSHDGGIAIYFLTGRKYIYQTLFCAFSLTKVSNEKFQFILVDDGSFDEKLVNQFKKQMPNVKIVLRDEIDKNLNKILPEEHFPFLRDKRTVYPHIRKLTDIHTIKNNEYKLVLDSDMLFWNEPIEIIEWLKKPQGCLYMLDSKESYGYERSLMQSLCKTKIPELINVGAIGIKSSIINWNDVEFWGNKLEEKKGSSYFLEQALSAMIIAKEEKNILKREEYIVNPKDEQLNTSKVKLHHYVDLSKKYYFEKAWKKYDR